MPLRTVRESFPSHGSSRSKISPVRDFPLSRGIRFIRERIITPQGSLAILVCGRVVCGRAAAFLRRQLRDASSDWRRLSFAFPGRRRFHILSCHERPDRRGHIRRITHRRWLLRSSQCCLCYPALRLGRPRTAWPRHLTAFPCSAFVTGWI